MLLIAFLIEHRRRCAAEQRWSRTPSAESRRTRMFGAVHERHDANVAHTSAGAHAVGVGAAGARTPARMLDSLKWPGEPWPGIILGCEGKPFGGTSGCHSPFRHTPGEPENASLYRSIRGQQRGSIASLSDLPFAELKLARSKTAITARSAE